MLGDIARIGPNELVTISPDVLRHINGVRGSYTKNPWFYRFARIDPALDNIFSEVDEKKHQRMRAKLSGGVGGIHFAAYPTYQIIYIKVCNSILNGKTRIWRKQSITMSRTSSI